MTNVMTEIESIVKENQNKPIFEALTIKQYEKVLEIILTSVKRYTSVPLTTFAAIGRPVKHQNQNQSSSSNSNSNSTDPTTRRPWIKTPPEGKSIKDYLAEMKKCKCKDNNCGFCEQPGHSASKCPHLCPGLREENQKPVSDCWVYNPKRNKTNWKDYDSDKHNSNDSNDKFDTDKSIPMSKSKSNQSSSSNTTSSSSLSNRRAGNTSEGQQASEQPQQTSESTNLVLDDYYGFVGASGFFQDDHDQDFVGTSLDTRVQNIEKPYESTNIILDMLYDQMLDNTPMLDDAKCQNQTFLTVDQKRNQFIRLLHDLQDEDEEFLC